MTVNRNINKNGESLVVSVLATVRFERDALKQLEERIGESAGAAVEILDCCAGRIVVTGMGKSGLIARKFAATLASTGAPALFLHPADALHGDLGVVSSEDVVICLSNSGETDELVTLLPYLKRFNVKSIAMTGNPESTLARICDCTLDIGRPGEADPHGLVPTATTTAMLALSDALSVALLTKRGVTREQFSLLHPGGSIGRRVLVRVVDLMHDGGNIPIVRHGVSVGDAIGEITAKGLGATLITDPSDILMGVFTDGDLRRLLQTSTALDIPIERVMTENPKCITADSLAAEALQRMQQHAINVLPVVGDDQRAVGIIHIQDLLRAGIV